MAGYSTRPTLPVWPGYSCGQSKEQFEAKARGQQVEFDRKMRKTKRKAYAALELAIANDDAPTVELMTEVVKELKAGRLPVPPKRLRTLPSGAPLVNPGGQSKAVTMLNRGSNEGWRS